MGWCEEWKPIFVMLAVEVAYAAMNTVIKTATDEGMNGLIFITLRQLIATLFMAPVAYFRERKTRPKLTTEIIVYLFFSAMFGTSLTQYLFFFGLRNTTATFACAFLNMVPVLTFLIALPFRLETLNVKTRAGIAKLLGTIICLVGATLLTFYKGVALTNTTHQSSVSKQQGRYNASYSTKQWMMGSMAYLAGCLSWSSWFLLQSKVGKKYPALYSGSFLIFFLGFLQGAVLSLATQKSFSVWVLKKKVEIITVIVSGIAGSGFCFLAMSWCVEKRGPVFTAAFTPLLQILVAGIDFSILHEPLYLGSVLGSVLVIPGLYFLLWGKRKEAQSSAAKTTEENEEHQVQLQTV
ncbi:WAT1-related protein At3g30340 [Elaeis guineensis]|uniref:WAT1-related protein n=1 Tax=Elaeis guineensis var. tenera TaxID=51953 RepID=A0A6I9SDF6_ELAGV|nr:WAT1-related protein At3g30340 [Elaeis guineensis]